MKKKSIIMLAGPGTAVVDPCKKILEKEGYADSHEIRTYPTYFKAECAYRASKRKEKRRVGLFIVGAGSNGLELVDYLTSEGFPGSVMVAAYTKTENGKITHVISERGPIPYGEFIERGANEVVSLQINKQEFLTALKKLI